MTMTTRYTVIDGEIIAEKRNGVRKLYVPDSQGSTVALLDNTQTQTDTFSYWPYGEVASRTGTTPTPFQYVGTAGYRQDSASKTYVRARVLDTQKGRWLTEDPNNFRVSNSNLYLYAYTRPSSLSDPSGKEPGTNFDTCGIFDPPSARPVPSTPVPKKRTCDESGNSSPFCTHTDAPSGGITTGIVAVNRYCMCGIDGATPMQIFKNTGWACATASNGCCQYYTDDVWCYDPNHSYHRKPRGNWYHASTIYWFLGTYKGKCQSNGKCSGNNDHLMPPSVIHLPPQSPK